jgi:hypothetical protein
MRIRKLAGVAMVIAVLASIIVTGAAQAAVAPSPTAPPAPKVTALALPFAWVDTAFPVLVIVKNQSDCTIDDPQICIEVPEGCVLELPEDECVEPWFGIGANGYGFAIWFVSCPMETDELLISVCVMGEVCGGQMTPACDTVEIEVWE